MVSSAITPTRTIAVLIGIAVLAVAGFALVRSGVLNPGSVQGAIPGPGTSSASPSASISASEDPSTSPSASPSPTTPEQIKQKNIADAKARLVEYYEATARVANNGYADWESQLRMFWGHPALRASLRDFYSEAARSGKYTVGAASVENMQSTGYKPSEVGNEEVHLRACVDFRNVASYSSDGEIIPRSEGAPIRYELDYVMRHHGPTSYWTVNKQIPHPEQAC